MFIQDKSTQEEEKKQTFEMNRFRPNFVVDGVEPFAEDTWKRIKIGGLTFLPVKPCSRCGITTVNQVSNAS